MKEEITVIPTTLKENRAWTTVFEIHKALEKQLYEKIFRLPYEDTAEQKMELFEIAPEELKAIDQAVERGWAPYVWQRIVGRPLSRVDYQGRPEELQPPQYFWTQWTQPFTFASAYLGDLLNPPKFRTFPKHYVSTLSSLLGKSYWHPTRKI